MNNNLAQKMENPVEKEPGTAQLQLVQPQKSTDPLDQIINKKTKREHVKDFGLVMSCFFAIVSCFQIYHGRTNITLALAAISCCFYLGSIYLPRAMMPVFSGWMFIGKYLEVVMTFVMLGLMWSVTFLPIGLIFKLMGKSTMTLKMDRNAKSYWENCDNSRADFKLLERQY